jgi:hypothetical protein
VSYQLLCLLRFLGTEGDGSSNSGLRSLYKKGKGTFELFKDRVVKAIRSMRDTYIFWPNADERKAISKRFDDKYCFRKCIGIIDGTLTPLAYPLSTEDAADYHGRKTGYGISSLILCDDKRMIR